MFKKRQLFYLKLLSFVLLLGIIPVIIVGIFSVMISSNSIQTKVEKEKEYSVYQTQLSVEQILKQVDQSLTNFAMSPLARQLLEEPMRPNQFGLLRDLKKELNYIQRFDSGVNDLLYINLEEGWIVRNRGLMRLSDDAIESLSQYDRQSMWFIKDKKDRVLPYATNNCNLYLEIGKSLPLGSASSNGLLVATIPICEMKQRISSVEDGGMSIVMNENNNVVFTNNEYEEYEQTLGKDIIDKINSNRSLEDQFYYENGNDKYTITYRVSNYNGWTYINLIRITDLKASSYAIGWFTFGICIVLIMILIIIAYIGSGKLYRPIQHIFQMFKTSPQLNQELKTNDELKEITVNIHRILNENQLLEGKLQIQKEQLQQFLVNKLVLGNASKEEIREKFPSHEKNDYSYIVMLIRLHSVGNSDFTSKDEDIILFAISTIMNEILNDKEQFTPIVVENKQVTVLHGNKNMKEFNQWVENVVATIQKAVTHALGVHIHIGLSGVYDDLIETNRAYQEGEVALKESVIHDEKDVVYFPSLEIQNGLKTFYPKQLEHNLFASIRADETEQAEQNLTKLLDEIFNNQYSYSQYERMMIRFFSNYYEFLEIHSLDIVNVEDRQPFIHRLFQLSTREEIERWLREDWLHPVIQQIQMKTEQESDSLSQRLIQIIHEEFDQDIKLEKIAERLHYNASYLSFLFKKETNMSFSEYLSAYRIDKAKDWLENTPMTVKEIAERLKYNNSQNFIRSFRKNVGMTPGNYRKNRAIE